MSSLTVELPESLREFVETQAAERGLEAAGDYLVALVGEARKKAAKERLEAHLLASLRSGPPIEVAVPCAQPFGDTSNGQVSANPRTSRTPISLASLARRGRIPLPPDLLPVE